MTARLDALSVEIEVLGQDRDSADYDDIACNPSFSFERPMVTYFGQETRVQIVDNRQSTFTVTVYDAVAGFVKCEATFSSVPLVVVAEWVANFIG